MSDLSDGMDDDPKQPEREPCPERSKRARMRWLERQCWELAARGWTQTRIGAKLGISQPSVCRYLLRAEARAIKSADQYVQGLKVRQSIALELMAGESLLAWERSKRPGRKRKTRSTTLKAPNGEGKIEVPADEVTREVAGRDGNPMFLDQARGAMKDLRDIWHVGHNGNDDDLALSIVSQALVHDQAALDLQRRRTEETALRVALQAAGGTDADWFRLMAEATAAADPATVEGWVTIKARVEEEISRLTTRQLEQNDATSERKSS
jgi:hypothetical protein